MKRPEKDECKHEEVLRVCLVRHTWKDSVQVNITSIESTLGELANEELSEYIHEKLSGNNIRVRECSLMKHKDHLYEYITITLVNNYKEKQCEFLIYAPEVEIHGHTYINIKGGVKDFCGLISIPNEDTLSNIRTMIYFGILSYNNLEFEEIYIPAENTDNYHEWINTFIDLYFYRGKLDIVFKDTSSTLSDPSKYQRLREIKSTLETIHWHGSKFISKNTQKIIKISLELTDRSTFKDKVFKSFHEINSPAVYIDGSIIASSVWIKVFNDVCPMNANTDIKAIKKTSMCGIFKDLINNFLSLLE